MPDEKRNHKTDRHGHIRRPRRAGHAESEPEHEKRIERDVGDRDATGDRDRHFGPPDAVEESEDRPEREPDGGAQKPRKPELRGEPVDLRLEAEWLQHQRPGEGQGREQRYREYG